MTELSYIFTNRLRFWWTSLSKSNRIFYSCVSVAFAVAVIVTLSFLMKPQYETLYVNLDPASAGEVVERLKEYKMVYRLENGGTTVVVARKDLYEARLKLATEGLPRSGLIGYEIFDKSNLGMTDFLQKVNYRRALEGEIAKSISHIREVRDVRVHLAIPEERLFKEDKKEATASIILTLSGTRSLSPHQVEGIAFLVASSVEGLRPDNVTILDSGGRLLSNNNGGSELASMSAWQLGMVKNVESYLRDKVQSVLTPVLGLENFVVSASVELNFEQVEQTVENYDPDNLAIRSEERNQEKSSEQNTRQDGQGKAITNSRENIVTNYEVNKTVQRIVNEIGNVKRLWVSVMVDGHYETVQGPDGKEVSKYTPRRQEELDGIFNIVKGTVGYDPERNDVLEVASVPFSTNQKVPEKEDFFTKFFTPERIDYWLTVGWKVFLVIAGFVIFMKIRKKFMEVWEKQKLEAQRAMAIKETTKEAERERIVAQMKAYEPKLIDHLKGIAKDQPDEILRVVKTMMFEEK